LKALLFQVERVRAMSSQKAVAARKPPTSAATVTAAPAEGGWGRTCVCPGKKL
jgi:hypothetical protein